ncbi:helix-turn-helix transcriptional regulator [Secundilactobacillus kimchicus]|uniref:helix-turn-helix transcriptional regulator n=1 Tax=Secundilactobacillus kimchicus TaxID=528209 RepID=UPI0024A8B44F|nr:helix-turn-helix transcriptional regulator [Secundilactobacillus kimchicus]
MQNILSKLREHADETQADLAHMLAVDQRTISKWEVGKSLPKPFQMAFIEDHYKVAKEQIFFEAFNYKMRLKTDLKHHNVVK